MTSLPLPFFPHGLARLEAMLAAPLLFAFDFDGTLAPIVRDPASARMTPPLARRMRALAGLGSVAVITGRSLGDLGRRLDFTPAYLIGNHGLEGLPGREAEREADRLRCLEWERDLGLAIAGGDCPDPGIRIENKVYTLSVHYRLAREPVAAEEALAGLIALVCPEARLMRGKCVFNLLPPGAPDKGRALLRLMTASGAAGALYLGDDVTDEDVFRLRRPDILGVRIGTGGQTCADAFLPRQDDVGDLLDALIERLLKHGAAGKGHDVGMNPSRS